MSNAKKKAKDKAVQCSHLKLTVPVSNGGTQRTSAYHLDLQLDVRRSNALERVFRALHGNSVRLADGSHVDRRVDAVRYLIDQIGHQLEESAPDNTNNP